MDVNTNILSKLDDSSISSNSQSDGIERKSSVKIQNKIFPKKQSFEEKDYNTSFFQKNNIEKVCSGSKMKSRTKLKKRHVTFSLEKIAKDSFKELIHPFNISSTTCKSRNSECPRCNSISSINNKREKILSDTKKIIKDLKKYCNRIKFGVGHKQKLKPTDSDYKVITNEFKKDQHLCDSKDVVTTTDYQVNTEIESENQSEVINKPLALDKKVLDQQMLETQFANASNVLNDCKFSDTIDSKTKDQKVKDTYKHFKLTDDTSLTSEGIKLPCTKLTSFNCRYFEVYEQVADTVNTITDSPSVHTHLHPSSDDEGNKFKKLNPSVNVERDIELEQAKESMNKAVKDLEQLKKEKNKIEMEKALLENELQKIKQKKVRNKSPSKNKKRLLEEVDQLKKVKEETLEHVEKLKKEKENFETELQKLKEKNTFNNQRIYCTKATNTSLTSTHNITTPDMISKILELIEMRKSLQEHCKKKRKIETTRNSRDDNVSEDNKPQKKEKYNILVKIEPKDNGDNFKQHALIDKYKVKPGKVPSPEYSYKTKDNFSDEEGL